MSDNTEKCMRTWLGKDGKEHYCTLPKGHATLICYCDECDTGKWFGKKLTRTLAALLLLSAGCEAQTKPQTVSSDQYHWRVVSSDHLAGGVVTTYADSLGNMMVCNMVRVPNLPAISCVALTSTAGPVPKDGKKDANK